MKQFVSTMVSYTFDGREYEAQKSFSQVDSMLQLYYGVPVKMFLSEPPPGKENSRINHRRARDWALSEEKDLLFFEDDIDINQKLFKRFLNQVLNSDNTLSPVFFYAHDTGIFLQSLYETNIIEKIVNKAKPIPPSIERFKTTNRLYFGQAVYIPHRFLRIMEGELRGHHKRTGALMPTDTLISHTATKHNIPAYITLPHPVQHRHVRNGREREKEGRDEKYSKSYDRGLRLAKHMAW